MNLPVASPTRFCFLVIGNSKYSGKNGTLRAALSDAKAIASTLKAMGGLGSVVLDAGLAKMKSAVEAYCQMLTTNKVMGVFYYHGYGINMEQENFLVPIDYKGANEDPSERCLSLDELLGFMKASTEGQLVFLDCCWNRDWGSFEDSVIHSGLDDFFLLLPEPAVVIVAAKPDSPIDQPERITKSVFSASIVRVLPTPGQKLKDAVIQIEKDVLETTSAQQQTWTKLNLSTKMDPFIFVPSPKINVTAETEFKDDMSFAEYCELFTFAAEKKDKLSQVLPKLDASMNDPNCRRQFFNTPNSMDAMFRAEKMFAKGKEVAPVILKWQMMMLSDESSAVEYATALCIGIENMVTAMKEHIGMEKTVSEYLKSIGVILTKSMDKSPFLNAKVIETLCFCANMHIRSIAIFYPLIQIFQKIIDLDEQGIHCFVKGGGIAACGKAMQRSKKNAEILTFAMEFLRNISKIVSIRSEFLKDALPAVADVLLEQYEHADIALDGIHILTNMSTTDQGRESIDKSGAGAALVLIINFCSINENLCSVAYVALCNIAVEESIVESLRKLKADFYAVQAIKRFRNAPLLTRPVISFLANMSDSEQSCATMENEDVFPTICEVYSEFPEDSIVVSSFVRILCNYMIQEADTFRQKALGPGFERLKTFSVLCSAFESDVDVVLPILSIWSCCMQMDLGITELSELNIVTSIRKIAGVFPQDEAIAQRCIHLIKHFSDLELLGIQEGIEQDLVLIMRNMKENLEISLICCQILCKLCMSIASRRKLLLARALPDLVWQLKQRFDNPQFVAPLGYTLTEIALDDDKFNIAIGRLNGIQWTVKAVEAVKSDPDALQQACRLLSAFSRIEAHQEAISKQNAVPKFLESMSVDSEPEVQITALSSLTALFASPENIVSAVDCGVIGIVMDILKIHFSHEEIAFLCCEILLFIAKTLPELHEVIAVDHHVFEWMQKVMNKLQESSKIQKKVLDLAFEMSSNDKLQEIQREAGVAKEACYTMKRMYMDEEVAMHALQLLSRLSLLRTIRATVQTQALKSVIACFEKYPANLEICFHACEIIRLLSYDNRAHPEISKENGIAPMIDAMNEHVEDLPLVQSVLSALYNISFSELLLSKIAGSMTILMKALHVHEENEQLRHDAICILANCCIIDRIRKQIVASHPDVVFTSIQTLKSYMNVEKVVIAAANTLTSLSMEERTCEEMRCSEVIPVLLECIKVYERKKLALSEILVTTANMGEKNEQAREDIAATDAQVLYFLNLIQKYTSDYEISARIMRIFRVVFQNVSIQEKVLRLNGMGIIFTNLRLNLKDREISQEGSRLLDLLAEQETNRMWMVSIGAFELILAICRATFDFVDVCSHCVHALTNLTEGAACLYIEMDDTSRGFTRQGGFRTIIKMITYHSKDNPAIVLKGFRLLKNIAHSTISGINIARDGVRLALSSLEKHHRDLDWVQAIIPLLGRICNSSEGCSFFLKINGQKILLGGLRSQIAETDVVEAILQLISSICRRDSGMEKDEAAWPSGIELISQCFRLHQRSERAVQSAMRIFDFMSSIRSDRKWQDGICLGEMCKALLESFSFIKKSPQILKTTLDIFRRLAMHDLCSKQLGGAGCLDVFHFLYDRGRCEDKNTHLICVLLVRSISASAFQETAMDVGLIPFLLNGIENHSSVGETFAVAAMESIACVTSEELLLNAVLEAERNLLQKMCEAAKSIVGSISQATAAIARTARNMLHFGVQIPESVLSTVFSFIRGNLSSEVAIYYGSNLINSMATMVEDHPSFADFLQNERAASILNAAIEEHGLGSNHNGSVMAALCFAAANLLAIEGFEQDLNCKKIVKIVNHFAMNPCSTEAIGAACSLFSNIAASGEHIQKIASGSMIERAIHVITTVSMDKDMAAIFSACECLTQLSCYEEIRPILREKECGQAIVGRIVTIADISIVELEMMNLYLICCMFLVNTLQDLEDESYLSIIFENEKQLEAVRRLDYLCRHAKPPLQDEEKEKSARLVALLPEKKKVIQQLPTP